MMPCNACGKPLGLGDVMVCAACSDHRSTKFVFPYVRTPYPDARLDQVGPPATKSSAPERKLKGTTMNDRFATRVADGLRCPGCCGPVAVHFNTGFDYPGAKSDDYHTYNCGGPEITQIGPHGTLAYIQVTDKREKQAALDEEFAEKQVSRTETAKKIAAGDHSADVITGCFPGASVKLGITGPLMQTTHGSDCSCATGRPYPYKEGDYNTIPELMRKS